MTATTIHPTAECGEVYMIGTDGTEHRCGQPAGHDGLHARASERSNAPGHITATCAALCTAGWAEAREAAAATGRTIADLAGLWDAGRIQVLTFSWSDHGTQRARHMVRLAEVQDSPRAPMLRIVRPHGDTLTGGAE